MTLRPSLPPDANGSVLKFQVFFIDFTLQHISIFGLQSLDIEPKRELDYLIIVFKHDFTFMAIAKAHLQRGIIIRLYYNFLFVPYNHF